MSDLISKSRLLETMESEQLRLMGEHQSVNGYHKRFVAGKYDGITWVQREIQSGTFNTQGWISVKERLPETRQRVLVLIDRENYMRWITCARYIAPRSVLADDFIDEDSWEFHDYDEETDTYWAPSGFYESNYYTDANYYIDDAVTHWMPLPAPPEADKA